MKKLLALIFIVILIFQGQANCQEITDSYQQKKLKGLVKELKEFEIGRLPPKLIRNGQTIDTLQIGYIEFDKNKRRIKNHIYGQSGDLEYINNYKYNSKGQLVETTSFRAGKINAKHLYKYNEQQLLIEGISYDGKKNETEKSIYSYNSRGKLAELKYYISKKLETSVLYTYNDETNTVEMKTYRAEGSLSYWEIKQHDAQGNLIELKKLDPSGKLISRYSYKYTITDKEKEIELISFSETNEIRNTTVFKSDLFENPIEQITYDSNGSVESKLVYQYQYEYDEKGNWISQTLSDSETDPQVILREITYWE